MAFEDELGVLQIADNPTRVQIDPYPIPTHEDAVRISGLADLKAPEIRWIIEQGGNGKYRVRQTF
jgi:hypothetical protein